MSELRTMAVITWSEAMSVGVPRLDRDHRVLIGLINRLAGGDQETANDRIIGEVLEALVAYTIFHFAREEQVMEFCGFPETETHREEHRLLAAEVVDLRARFLSDRQSVSLEDLLRFLGDWLNHHILLQDMAYRAIVGDGREAERVAVAFGEFDAESMPGRAAALSGLINAG